jgi:hypothetical protein
MDDQIKTKFAEIEKRYHKRYILTQKSFNEKLKEVDKRITFLGKIPNYAIAALTAIIIAIGFLNLGQINSATEKVDSFLTSWPTKFEAYKNELEKEIESKLIGDPNKSRIKFFKEMDITLSGKTIPAKILSTNEGTKLIFNFIVDNQSDYSTSDLFCKIYFGQPSDILPGTSSDEPNYARELFFATDKLPTPVLPGHASFFLNVSTGNKSFIKLFENNIRKIPIMCKIYHGPSQPSKAEFFIDIVGELTAGNDIDEDTEENDVTEH